MLPLVASTGKVMELVRVAFATSNQFVPRPMVRSLVCYCNRQPM